MKRIDIKSLVLLGSVALVGESWGYFQNVAPPPGTAPQPTTTVTEVTDGVDSIIQSVESGLPENKKEKNDKSPVLPLAAGSNIAVTVTVSPNTLVVRDPGVSSIAVRDGGTTKNVDIPSEGTTNSVAIGANAEVVVPANANVATTGSNGQVSVSTAIEGGTGGSVSGSQTISANQKSGD